MSYSQLFSKEKDRREALVTAHVVPISQRCVQCGICNFNCPLGIDIRSHSWADQPVIDSRCITCGICIDRCPRGALKLEPTSLFSNGDFD